MNDQDSLFQWDDLRKELMKRYGGGDRVHGKNMDMSWIDSYVENILKSAMPKNILSMDDQPAPRPTQQSKKEKARREPIKKMTVEKPVSLNLQPEIVEVHDQIILLINDVSETEARKYHIQLNGNTMMIRDTETGLRQEIKLPSGFAIRTAAAFYKYPTLEIRVVKEENTLRLDVPVEFK